ncbi:helix-turn-helix domain-containing protein [Stieleria sp. TO1_6]|uniref:helix-turn-helix domain-containing protein n=1 Tax=Stieleria tagensis TaxID=2956795 RepID=UPI00209B8512|nr:helix-turn-helix domain-containing protein [Stieleria tagensis]MCO8124494.1 helix-turn-helix domain-containing protein [Stieleria tagensis]
MRDLQLHTVDEVADILRTHRETVRQWIVAGELEGTPMGRGKVRRKWLVSDEALRKFVQYRTEAAQPGPKRKPAPQASGKQWV